MAMSTTEQCVRKMWEESVLKQQLLTDHLKSNVIVYGLQFRCTRAFALVGVCKSYLLQLKKGKWREKLLSKWELGFTPNHAHFYWN